MAGAVRKSAGRKDFFPPLTLKSTIRTCLAARRLWQEEGWGEVNTCQVAVGPRWGSAPVDYGGLRSALELTHKALLRSRWSVKVKQPCINQEVGVQSDLAHKVREVVRKTGDSALDFLHLIPEREREKYGSDHHRR